MDRSTFCGLRPWLKQANCLAGTWPVALSEANTLADPACGLSDGSVAGDWRMPNFRELHSLIDFGQVNPPLPPEVLFGIFTGYSGNPRWSSTTNANALNRVWTIQFTGSGTIFSNHKLDGYYVWPIRGGQ